MAITDSWLKANLNKARDKVMVRTDRDGLGVRASRQGKLTFQVRYSLDGRQQRLDVGTYPLTTLRMARDAATEIHAQLERGEDPKVVRELAKRQRQEAVTVEGLFHEWYAGYCARHKTNAGLIKRSFEIHVFPELGILPADQVDRHHWMTLLEGVVARYPAIADRLLINTKQMYKWGSIRQRTTAEPLAGITSKADLRIKKKKTKRHLDHDEVRLMFDALEHSRMSPKNAVFLKLLLFFGCRSGELRLSNIEHWDLKRGIWTVPAENHKTGSVSDDPIVRPIVEPVRPWVEEAIRLSASSKAGRGPLFNNRGSSERMGRSSVLPLPYNIMQWARRHRGVEMEHWSVHDLRRTMRSNLSNLTQPHLAEMMVGHVLPGEWGTYDMYEYIDEMAEVYEKWWIKLEAILAGDHAASDAS